jgi:hypothetical protein
MEYARRITSTPTCFDLNVYRYCCHGIHLPPFSPLFHLQRRVVRMILQKKCILLILTAVLSSPTSLNIRRTEYLVHKHFGGNENHRKCFGRTRNGWCQRHIQFKEDWLLGRSAALLQLKAFSVIKPCSRQSRFVDLPGGVSQRSLPVGSSF